jgi:hypothetical protein
VSDSEPDRNTTFPDIQVIHDSDSEPQGEELRTKFQDNSDGKSENKGKGTSASTDYGFLDLTAEEIQAWKETEKDMLAESP